MFSTIKLSPQNKKNVSSLQIFIHKLSFVNKVSKDLKLQFIWFHWVGKITLSIKRPTSKEATPGYIVTFSEVLTKCVLFVSRKSENCQDERRSGRNYYFKSPEVSKIISYPHFIWFNLELYWVSFVAVKLFCRLRYYCILRYWW